MLEHEVTYATSVFRLDPANFGIDYENLFEPVASYGNLPILDADGNALVVHVDEIAPKVSTSERGSSLATIRHRMDLAAVLLENVAWSNPDRPFPIRDVSWTAEDSEQTVTLTVKYSAPGANFPGIDGLKAAIAEQLRVAFDHQRCPAWEPGDPTTRPS